MAEIEVKAKKNETEVSVNYDFGDNVEDAVAKFGDTIVFNNFVAQSKIQLQALIRSRIERGASCDDIPTVWKPGVKLSAPAVDPLKAAAAAFKGMDADEKAAFIAMLKGDGDDQSDSPE